MFEKQQRHQNTGRAVLFGQEQRKILDPDELEGGGIAEPDACVIRGGADKYIKLMNEEEPMTQLTCFEDKLVYVLTQLLLSLVASKANDLLFAGRKAYKSDESWSIVNFDEYLEIQ